MTNVGVYEIAIAGLLHDVGKLLQRARVPLSNQAERMEQMLCPTEHSGYASHRHVLWTNDFIEVIANNLPKGLNTTAIKDLASYHHRPSKPEDWLIAEADRLASGHDRRPDESDQGRQDFRSIPLYCALARLDLKGKEENAHTPAWKPLVLQPDETIYPSYELSADEIEISWQELAEKMLKEAKELDLSKLSDNLALQSLISFTERNLTLVPDSAIDRADTSLFDHCVITAALATAMFQFHKVQGNLSDERAIRDREIRKFRFLVGSFRGIQDFIFDLPDEQQRGIAKTYRANSFYVSLLTEAVVLRLLRAAGLPMTNCVMSAGGRFTLLIDATEKTLSAVEHERETIQDWLIQNHLGMIRLTLATDIVVSGYDLLDGRFSNVYKRMEHQVNSAKEQILSDCFQKGGRWRSERFLLKNNPKEAREKSTAQAREIGKTLPRASTLALFSDETSSENGLLRQSADVLGFKMQLGNSEEKLSADKSCFVRRLWTEVNQTETIWLPYLSMANYIPLRSKEDIETLKDMLSPQEYEDLAGEDEESPKIGEPLTFGELAYLSCRKVKIKDRQYKYIGQPMLACLKADVDHLGLLFSEGFERHDKENEGKIISDLSFARLATLSRFLDLFFKGYLTYKFKSADSSYRLVYTVFAGGDDLMLIGPWHVMFNLALDIHKWLSGLTGGNPSITLSASLVLAHPKMPPSQMARMATNSLQKAKNDGRNRIAVFNRTLSWEQFHQGLEFGKKLDKMLRREQSDKSGLSLNSGFVYRLLLHAQSAERVTERISKGKRVSLTDLTWRSHYHYDLRRNVKVDSSASQAQKKDLKWLQELLPLSIKSDHIAAVIIGAIYALYMNRKLKEKNNENTAKATKK